MVTSPVRMFTTGLFGSFDSRTLKWIRYLIRQADGLTTLYSYTTAPSLKSRYGPPSASPPVMGEEGGYGNECSVRSGTPLGHSYSARRLMVGSRLFPDP